MKPEELHQHKIDRTGWREGPWDNEPDRADWEHAGLPCFALRNQHGNWCGYAGVAQGHPLYGVPYTNEAVDLDVHGGLTYSAACRPPICHVPKPGEPDDVWWFGFDCGHAFDFSPGMDATLRRVSEGQHGGPAFDTTIFDMPLTTYKDLGYVQAETCRLAEQLALIST